jgi:hypothetical protein
MNTIVIQIADFQWTTQAMHLACSMARMMDSELILLRLMQVKTPSHLGFDLAVIPPTTMECHQIDEYTAIAEDYGVAITLHQMQYTSFPDAVVQAAEHLNAAAVFARFPQHTISLIQKFEIWNAQRQLAALSTPLYTLEPHDSPDRMTIITHKPVRHRESWKKLFVGKS